MAFVVHNDSYETFAGSDELLGNPWPLKISMATWFLNCWNPNCLSKFNPKQTGLPKKVQKNSKHKILNWSSSDIFS